MSDDLTQVGVFGSSRIPGSLGGLGSNSDTELGLKGPKGRLAKRPCAFPKIPRNDLISSLNERLAEPMAIAQKSSHLCGPASLMYLLATYKPNLYQSFVTDLYEYGEAMLGSLRVKPGADCKNFDLSGRLAAADWVALAGLRDSENLFFDVDSLSQTWPLSWINGIAGINLPNHIESWLEATNFSVVENNTNLYITKNPDDFRRAETLFRQGCQIILFVDATGIQKGARESSWFGRILTTANHWVVLREVMQLTDDSVEFSVFSWGRPDQGADSRLNDRVFNGNFMVPQDPIPMTLNHWCQYFYGYIACKP